MSNVTDDDIRRYSDTTDDEASETICLIALGHQATGVLSHMSQTMARALVEMEIEATRRLAASMYASRQGRGAAVTVDLDAVRKLEEQLRADDDRECDLVERSAGDYRCASRVDHAALADALRDLRAEVARPTAPSDPRGDTVAELATILVPESESYSGLDLICGAARLTQDLKAITTERDAALARVKELEAVCAQADVLAGAISRWESASDAEATAPDIDARRVEAIRRMDAVDEFLPAADTYRALRKP